ncbi:hypothetical protein GOP47_0026333 [Adiantum capillus-veneris]|nr:hypothetical protein GOP47_0026333 [Adiantum capillus-veneris]
MAFVTFAGRVLFAAAFFSGVWLKFVDEEMYLRKLEPVIAILRSYMTSMGVLGPELQSKHLLDATMVVQGLAASLFLAGSSFGAYLMLILMVAAIVCDLFDLSNHDASSLDYTKQFMQVLKHLSIVGALLFFLGMKNQAAVKSQKKGIMKVKAV